MDFVSWPGESWGRQTLTRVITCNFQLVIRPPAAFGYSISTLFAKEPFFHMWAKCLSAGGKMSFRSSASISQFQ
jgi:hypothetical protein